MLQPWMGSDFTNDDLVKESSVVNDYTHVLLKKDSTEGQNIYLVESTPKPGTAVIWGKIVRWVRQNDFVPLKEEYYSDRGKLVKVLEFSDVGPVSDRVIPLTWTMVPVNKKGFSTTIRLVDVQYNQPVDENIFTLQNLKKVE